MRKLYLVMLCAAVLFNTWTVNLLAQNGESKGQLFSVYEEVIKPSMVEKYEAAVKEFVAEISKHKLAVPFIRTSMRDDFHYYFVIPVENLADAENIDKAFGEVVKRVGDEQWQALEKKFDGTSAYHINFMARKMTDLSYAPENPRLKPEEISFLHWDFYYLQAGKVKEASAIAKEYVALMKGKNIPDGYDIYLGEMGTEMPLLVVVQWARNAAEFYGQTEKTNELLGEAGKKLGARALAITRKFQHINGKARPDLSYFPEKEMTAKE
ncbi:MAG: hypothetical protein ACE5HO_18820 [bacterium]